MANKKHILKKEKMFYEECENLQIKQKQELINEQKSLINKNVYKDKIDTVYVYHFKVKNAVYIGRSIYPKLRDHQHRIRKNDSVYKFSLENDLEIPEMEILENNLTIFEGAEKEKEYENYYRNNGYILINKKPCGSLGYLTKGKWNKEKCFEEAKKYTKRSEFQRNSSHAFHIAFKNGWIDEMDWLPKTEQFPKGYWKNKENVINEAKKYSTLKDFSENSKSAYKAACQYGFLDELEWLDKKEKLPFGYWKDKNHVIEEAKKYKSKKEFQTKNQSAYWAALKYGYLDELTWLVKRKSTKKGSLNNREYILSEGKKYKTKSSFMRGNRSAYQAAHRYGFIKEMDWFE